MKGNSWWIMKESDGGVLVIFESGKVVRVKNDGVTGYDFVLWYLKMLEKKYRSHLMAADLLLQDLLKDKYRNVRKIKNVYNSYLATVSLSCGFASNSQEPCFKEYFGFFFSRGECPIRSACPYNGYHSSHKGNRLVCCHPVYELPLTISQCKAAELLVNTAYSLSDIAAVLCISEGRMRNLASVIYETLGVENRQELVLLLKGKRLV